MTIQTFTCPSCVASLEVDDQSDAASIVCPYCGTTVIVPESLRRQKTVPNVSVTVSRNGRSSRGCLLFSALLVVIIGGLVPLLLLAPVGVEEGAIELPETISLARSGFLSETAVVGGEEGIGPGFFNDTRFLGVDRAGFWYAADFEDGRVQRFDAEGNYVSQWTHQSDTVLLSMVADQNGRVYLLQGLDTIWQYDGQSGEQLGQLPEPPFSLSDMVIRADGSLLAVGRDGAVLYNSDGALVQSMPDIFEIVDGPVTIRDVAVDGANNFYLLPTFNTAVYKFDANGQFIDRIGQEGDAPGMFRGALALAVDGQGCIYVEDAGRIQRFDGGGQYLDGVPVSGASFALLFDAQNKLLRMNRNGNQIEQYMVTE